MTHDEFLREIELFLVSHEMSPTRFGILALNDRELVRRLRRGSDVRLTTMEKIRGFMRRSNQAPQKEDGLTKFETPPRTRRKSSPKAAAAQRQFSLQAAE